MDSATAATNPASSTEEGPSAAHRLLVGLLAVVFLLTPYLFGGDGRTGGNELVGDGLLLATQHPVLVEIQEGTGSLADTLTSTWWGEIHPEQTLYRPLSTLALGLCGSLAGTYVEADPGTAAVPYHLVAIALKAMCALLVLELGWVLLRNRRMALCAGALFATLPVHGEALFDVAGIAELLCTALSLGAWIAWVRAGDRPLARPADLAAALGLMFAATFAKESALALPLVFFLTDIGRAPEGGFGAGVRHALGKLPALVLCAVVIAASVGLRFTVVGGLMPEFSELNTLDNPLLFEDVLTRVANGLRLAAAGVLAMVGINVLSSGQLSPGAWDIRTGVGPFPYSADYSASQVEVLGPLAPMNLLGLLFLGGTIAAAVLLYRRCRIRAALWLCTFGAMAVTANVLAPIGTIYAERLLVFPSAALVLCLAAFLGRRGTSGVVAGLLLAVGGGVWTWARADDWRDQGALWQHTAQRTSTDSARAHYNYGIDLLRDNIKPLARDHFEQAIELSPGYADAHAQLGVVLAAEFKIDEAVAEYQEAARLRLEARDWTPVPISQQPLLGVANMLDLATRVRLHEGDIEKLKQHVTWLEELLTKGYRSPVVPQKMGETYRVLFAKTSNPELREEYDRLAVESFEQSLAIERTPVTTRSYADFLEAKGDPESVGRARALYAQLPEPENETERAMIVLARGWHQLEESPDTVLRDVEELLERQREAGILTQDQHFEAKLLQALSKLELLELDPSGVPDRLREIHNHLRSAINLKPLMTAETHLAQVSLVQILVRLGEFEEARGALESMLLQSPEELGPQPALRALLGRVYESLGRPEDAREAYETASQDLLADDGSYLDRLTLRDARQGLVRMLKHLEGEEALDPLFAAWHEQAPGEHDELALQLEALQLAASGDVGAARERVRLLETELGESSAADPFVTGLGADLDALAALAAVFDPIAMPVADLHTLVSYRLQFADLDGAFLGCQTALARDLPGEDRAKFLDLAATISELQQDYQSALDSVREALSLEGISPQARAVLQRRAVSLEGAAAAN